jgi:hypothetical protein
VIYQPKDVKMAQMIEAIPFKTRHGATQIGLLRQLVSAIGGLGVFAALLWIAS